MFISFVAVSASFSFICTQKVKISADRADIKASGAGKILISVKNNLTIKVSGASKIEYYGDPVVSKNTRGVSIVRRISSTIPQS